MVESILWKGELPTRLMIVNVFTRANMRCRGITLFVKTFPTFGIGVLLVSIILQVLLVLVRGFPSFIGVPPYDPHFPCRYAPLAKIRSKFKLLLVRLSLIRFPFLPTPSKKNVVTRWNPMSLVVWRMTLRMNWVRSFVNVMMYRIVGRRLLMVEKVRNRWNRRRILQFLLRTRSRILSLRRIRPKVVAWILVSSSFVVVTNRRIIFIVQFVVRVLFLFVLRGWEKFFTCMLPFRGTFPKRRILLGMRWKIVVSLIVPTRLRRTRIVPDIFRKIRVVGRTFFGPRSRRNTKWTRWKSLPWKWRGNIIPLVWKIKLFPPWCRLRYLPITLPRIKRR